MATFSSHSSKHKDPTSSKDKRYAIQVEKALSTFDALEEWADYIAFLSRLQKALQLSDDLKSRHTVSWIPHSHKVANKLSLCLSTSLPNGVHQKALSIYDSILMALTKETFNSQASMWIPGLFPLFNYCSVQVKPQIINIYKLHFLANANSQVLHRMSKPFILSLLPGLDDENSEVFQDVVELMDQFKLSLDDDSHFWECMFLSIITNPEKRLGAYFWCVRRLPLFTSIKQESEEQAVIFSDEAQACLNSEPGLVVRAFAAVIDSDYTSDNSSGTFVARGFFDLLLSHLPLDSDLLNKVVHQGDKELLVMSCCRATLRKDMSLTRRLWNWLLGPEVDSLKSERHSDSRADYFSKYGLHSVAEGILKTLKSESSIKAKIDSVKMASILIMDKWEISHLLTPKVFQAILETCYDTHKSKDGVSSRELFLSVQTFFDGVEADYIWSEIVPVLLNGESSRLDVVNFIFQNFDLREEEMVTIHAPIALLAVLMRSQKEDGADLIREIEFLVYLLSKEAFGQDDTAHEEVDRLEIQPKIEEYYSNDQVTKQREVPYNPPTIAYLIFDNFSRVMKEKLFLEEEPQKYSIMFCHLAELVPRDIRNSILKSMVKDVLEMPITESITPNNDKQRNLHGALSVSKLSVYFMPLLSPEEKVKLLTIILSNIWIALTSNGRISYQVEAVKCIFDLQINYSLFHIEAGIVRLLLNSSIYERIAALGTLWTHSQALNDSDAMLARPLFILLDDLQVQDSKNSLMVNDFIDNVVKNGSANRLLKMITDPLLKFDFMRHDKDTIGTTDDVSLFEYHLDVLVRVVEANVKQLRDAFSNEFAVTDSKLKINLFKDNEWNVSTYKSLLLMIIEKFLNLLLVANAFDSSTRDFVSYGNAVDRCLRLYKYLLSGNEADFSQRFLVLLQSCSKIVSSPYSSNYQMEMVEATYLDCISHFLNLSKNMRIALNLLHVEDDAKESPFVHFFINGITSARTVVLLKLWVLLLVSSLYLFNESVYSVILIVNDCLLRKIDKYFSSLSQPNSDEYEDIERAINIVLGGVEDLLSITHSYLMTSKAKSNQEITNSTPESGFFGNVIQGVFQLESPALKTSEQNKLFSVLISFQDAVNSIFKVWAWADSDRSVSDSLGTTAIKSRTYVAHKLKFKTRKVLETLMDLERQEVIECLISTNEPLVVKLLHVLDGGRCQVTLPYIYDTITSFSCPQILPESKRSSGNVHISANQASSFLIKYIESIDTDSLSDIWTPTTQFFKDVLTYANQYKDVLSDLLQAAKHLMDKARVSKSSEQKKYRKEISDILFRLIQANISPKNQVEAISTEKKEISTETANLTSNIFVTIHNVVEHLDEMFPETERATSCVSSILQHMITPSIKAKHINEVPTRVLKLTLAIGKHHPIKAWKVLVYDAFMDNSFFETQPAENLSLWEEIIGLWIKTDKEKLKELIIKFTPSVQSTAGNIFTWGESSEIEGKVFVSRRVTYLLMAAPKNFFLVYLGDLFSKIEYSLGNSCPFAYRAHIMVLFRAIVTCFDDVHLIPRWSIIVHELLLVFESIAERDSKHLLSMSKDELQLVLASCKLLDQLLLARHDEFTLSDWLFVSAESKIVTRPQQLHALVDIIASKDLVVAREPPIKIDQPSGLLKPLLHGVVHLENISRLRLFFESLSMINFERTYGLYEVDYDSVRSDIFNDLILRG